MAFEHDWPTDWLNDGVKGYLSSADRDEGTKRLFKTYPSEREPGLRVQIATPHYLFAMKCLAMRICGVGATQDRQDIERLASMLGIISSDEAISLVLQFYPASRISPKTQLGFEEMFGGPSG